MSFQFLYPTQSYPNTLIHWDHKLNRLLAKKIFEIDFLPRVLMGNFLEKRSKRLKDIRFEAFRGLIRKRCLPFVEIDRHEIFLLLPMFQTNRQFLQNFLLELFWPCLDTYQCIHAFHRLQRLLNYPAYLQ